MSTRRATDYIIVHCSATGPANDIGADEIRRLHASSKGTMVEWNGGWEEAFGWSDIGYHQVIRRNGKLEFGRAPMAVGAHAKGFNTSSVGICLVGGINASGRADSNFTRAQWHRLEMAVSAYKNLYPDAVVIGHRDLPGVVKECPSFDVPAWWKK